MSETGFSRYDKVHRMDHYDEVSGLLNGSVYIFEKMDGANCSIWRQENMLYVGKRSSAVGWMNLDTGEQSKDSFRGLSTYVFNNKDILQFFELFPFYRLCAEYLVKHTINYPPEHLNKVYVFDVQDTRTGEFLIYDEYDPILKKFPGILFLKPFAVVENPSVPSIVDDFLGNTEYGAEPQGEGVVLKNYGFVNQYGRKVYGKLVCKEFIEINKQVFKDNLKSMDVEEKIITVYINYNRVKKIVDKIEDVQGSVSRKDTPRVLSTVYHDMVVEEIWTIIRKLKKPTINFALLEKTCNNLTKNIFFGILNEKYATEL